MTNTKAIKVIRSECYVANLLDIDRTVLVNTALDTAIKALEAENVLDKIIAEIDEQYDKAHPYNISCAEGLEMALEIIDKYKAESKLDGDPIDIDKAVEHYEGTLETLKGIDLEVDV